MSIHMATPEHEVLYQELAALLGRHPTISSKEILAVAANMVGKIIAMQDQRAMTKDEALKIVIANIEFGNQQIINGLLKNTGGNA